jgi:hypothetical protein
MIMIASAAFKMAKARNNPLLNVSYVAITSALLLNSVGEWMRSHLAKVGYILHHASSGFVAFPRFDQTRL